jgi:cytochrome c-type biogenesis protein
MPAALHSTKKFNLSSLQPGYFSAFLTGLAFAFAWTPCLGPVLTGLVIMAAAQETAIKGASLLFVYSLGLGLPFILISFFGGFFLGKMKNMNRFIKYTQKAMGILIILLGILFLTDIKILSDLTH